MNRRRLVAQTSQFVPDWLAKRALLTPDKIGLIEGLGGPEITYREWNARANRTANYLRALGVGEGDLVSVYASNCPQYLDLFWAAGKIGAILHNLNWRLTVHELREIISDARPVVLFYSEDWYAQVDELRPSFDSIGEVVALGKPGPDDRLFSERDDQPDGIGDLPDLTLDHPWGIYYTGGTTGLPKGAILTHGNITWNSVNTIVS